MRVGDGVPEREPAGQLGSRGLAPSQQELQAQEPNQFHSVASISAEGTKFNILVTNSHKIWEKSGKIPK